VRGEGKALHSTAIVAGGGIYLVRRRAAAQVLSDRKGTNPRVTALARRNGAITNDSHHNYYLTIIPSGAPRDHPRKEQRPGVRVPVSGRRQGKTHRPIERACEFLSLLKTFHTVKNRKEKAEDAGQRLGYRSGLSRRSQRAERRSERKGASLRASTHPHRGIGKGTTPT